MNKNESSIDRITYAGVVIYILLATINIDDVNFLLNSNKILLPVLEVEVSLDWFGVISPILIFTAFAIHYELDIPGPPNKSRGNFHKIKTLTDWIFLLLAPLSLLAIFTRYSDYQSKFYFAWHLIFFLACSFYSWQGISYKGGQWIELIKIIYLITTLPLIAIAFDVIFIPNNASPTLWITKNTTLLYKDGDRTVWFLPNISISRDDFLLEKTHHKSSEEFLSKIASSDIGFLLNKASSLVLYDRSLKYLQLPNQVIPFLTARNVDFTGANFASANFPAAYISDSKFDGADLSFADFRGAQIFKTKISESLMGGANFRGAFLGLIKVNDTSMGGNTFEGARIQYSTFHNVNFSGAKLSGSRLVEVIFNNIDLPESQYIFDSSFSSEKEIKIEVDEEKAFIAFEDAFCQRQMNFLNNIEIHRVMQIKKFESNRVAAEFLNTVKNSKKCSLVMDYYKRTDIDMFDYFRK